MKSQKNILIIDDEEAIRRSFELALKESGYKVTTVSSGEKGIDELKNNSYQLVFLDLKMPQMNGTQTLKKIREFSSSIPIYIVTAFHKEFLIELDDLRKSNLSFQIIKKPIGSLEILAIAQSVLERPMQLQF
jgi:DNA-binding response OmpR family regulator